MGKHDLAERTEEDHGQSLNHRREWQTQKTVRTTIMTAGSTEREFPFRPPLIVAVLLHLIWFPVGSYKGSDTPHLRIMSFNIRYGSADDGDNGWKRRNSLVLEVLRAESLDIIALQEALRFQLDEIRAALPSFGELGVGRDDGMKKGEYAAILYRLDRFTVVRQGTFWFSDTPMIPGSMSWGNEVTRICTWALFQDKEEGVSFYIYNVHLDHQSQASREHSVRTLLDTIRNRSTPAPVMITGDFNAGEHNKAVLLLQAEGFYDTFRVMHPADTLVGTFHAFRGSRTGEKIDYIFTDHAGIITRAAIVHSKRNGHYPSDHFPVTTDIQLIH